MELSKGVLLIDDEPRFRDGVAELLSPVLPSPWFFLAPETLKEALEVVIQPQIVLALVDHTLSSHGYQELQSGSMNPGNIRGFEVCKRILAVRTDLPIVAFSKGNNGTMRTLSTFHFDRKQHLLDQEVKEVRAEFVNFMLTLIGGLSPL
ncbi:MAG: hypothetical protein WC777_05020 [Candidatus Gracilibacteria bacterium]|jgi:CheY-like chemotaxis protein